MSAARPGPRFRIPVPDDRDDAIRGQLQVLLKKCEATAPVDPGCELDEDDREALAIILRRLIERDRFRDVLPAPPCRPKSEARFYAAADYHARRAQALQGRRRLPAGEAERIAEAVAQAWRMNTSNVVELRDEYPHRPGTALYTWLRTQHRFARCTSPDPWGEVVAMIDRFRRELHAKRGKTNP